MDDGWIRLKVRQRMWINRCNWETRECITEPASGRADTPVADVWLFADCQGGKFASSSHPDRSDAFMQSVFLVDGSPRFQTVYGNPFM